MKDLKEYYNTFIRVGGTPPFEELPEDYKTSISKTLGFAAFQLNKAFVELGKATSEAIKNWQNPLKKLNP